ncbi:DUF6463 family protein [Longispora albida]|uniref:DUF6463 family protein n=1 Tax=Longispora albida TaxID=203523 RepID=UPI00037BCDED|nr:DUF6463 family protein [Longispora albida]
MNRMAMWAGGFMVFVGAGHTLIALVLVRGHIGGWLSGGLWGSNGHLSNPSTEVGAYWVSLSSFGPVMAVLGCWVLAVARKGQTPPSFVGWAVAIMSVLDLAMTGLSPAILNVAGGIMLAIAARRDAPRRPAETAR